MPYYAISFPELYDVGGNSDDGRVAGKDSGGGV